jgi:hypothetical protein
MLISVITLDGSHLLPESASCTRILLIRVSDVSAIADCSWLGLMDCLVAFFKRSDHLGDLG